MSEYGVISGTYFPVFSPNTGKYGPEITPYLDTFHAMLEMLKTNRDLSKQKQRSGPQDRVCRQEGHAVDMLLTSKLI